jgi:hypothetical protein
LLADHEHGPCCLSAEISTCRVLHARCPSRFPPHPMHGTGIWDMKDRICRQKMRVGITTCRAIALTEGGEIRPRPWSPSISLAALSPVRGFADGEPMAAFVRFRRAMLR